MPHCRKTDGQSQNGDGETESLLPDMPESKLYVLYDHLAPLMRIISLSLNALYEDVITLSPS